MPALFKGWSEGRGVSGSPVAPIALRLIQDRDVASISIAGGGGDQRLSGLQRLMAIGPLWRPGNGGSRISALGLVANRETWGSPCRFSSSEQMSQSLGSIPCFEPRIRARRRIRVVRLVDAEPLLAAV